MDAQLQKAFDIANFMTTLASQKKILLEQYLQNSIFFYNGYSFQVTRELISFVKVLVDLNQQDVVLIDDNNLPANIADTNKFLEDILNVHALATNEYHTQYQKLKTSRSVESLVDL